MVGFAGCLPTEDTATFPATLEIGEDGTLPPTGAVPSEPARTAACVALRSEDGRMRARLALS